MTIALKFVVNYELLGLEESYQRSCFEHAFSKACQYGIVYDKVCRGLKHVSIEFAQSYIQKCITWPKKFGKGK
jgi:hypothetical protein